MEATKKNNNIFQETDLSANMEDYMETIALLSRKSKVVRVKDIAKSLNIKMPSVSAALIKLREKELIEYEKYGYVELTPKGKEIAEKIYNKHSCISDFLRNLLYLNKEQADDEACKLEHYLSANTCSQINSFMEFFNNEKDNKSDWTIKLKDHMNIRYLNNLFENDSAKIIDANYSDDINQQLNNINLETGTKLKVTKVDINNNQIILNSNEKEIIVPITLAMEIKVKVI